MDTTIGMVVDGIPTSMMASAPDSPGDRSDSERSEEEDEDRDRRPPLYPGGYGARARVPGRDALVVRTTPVTVVTVATARNIMANMMATRAQLDAANLMLPGAIVVVTVGQTLRFAGTVRSQHRVHDANFELTLAQLEAEEPAELRIVFHSMVMVVRTPAELRVAPGAEFDDEPIRANMAINPVAPWLL
jgi:hypothetical protein